MYEKDKLLKKINKMKQRVLEMKEKHGETPSKDFNYHGGWDLGYHEGQLSLLENLYDEFYDKEEPLEVIYEKMFGVKYGEKL